MIKNILIKIYNHIISIVRLCRWTLDYRYIKGSCQYLDIPKLDIKQRSIILVPHADDEWIGCSSVIRNSSEVILLNMDMQGGDSSALHNHRLRELEQIAKKYAVKLITVSSFKEQSLYKIINYFDPHYLYLPFFFDWHEEHIMTMRILHNVLLGNDYKFNIVMYQVSLPIIPKICTHYYPLKKQEFVSKWSIFHEFYKSQLRIPYKRFSINERINGAYVKEYAAEFFCLTSVTEWLLNINNWILSDYEKSLILRNLLKINSTRRLLTDFYDKRVWKRK